MKGHESREDRSLSLRLAPDREGVDPTHGGEAGPVPRDYGDSDAYDRYMGRWSALLARQFVAFSAIETADRVLDVGAGTGALTAVIATETRASRIVGVDPVPQFVRTAQRRFGNHRVSFERGEVGLLAYPDSAFDATLAQLSLDHVSDRRNAVGEMMRVTRSGGIVAACEWDSGIGMEMCRLLAETLVAVDPQAAAQGLLRHHTGAEALRELWTDCGIGDAEEVALLVPLRFRGFDDLWTPFIEGPAWISRCLAALDPPRQDDFRRRLRRRLLADEPDGPFTLQARARAVRGRLP